MWAMWPKLVFFTPFEVVGGESAVDPLNLITQSSDLKYRMYYTHWIRLELTSVQFFIFLFFYCLVMGPS